MNYNYTLRYRTFDSLLEDVKVDLRNLAADTSIEPAQLFKVATRVNYDLGLRINKTKEKVLEVCKGKTKLPDDFYVMNFALMCGKYKEIVTPGQGTNIQEVTPEYRPWVEANYCSDISNPIQPACLTKCGNSYGLIQVINQTVREYTHFMPIRFQDSQFVDCDCPNLKWHAMDTAYIKDGWIYFNFDEGNVYINYQGDLTDDHGNLLVPDHPFLNEYYEYALKKRILENLIMDNVNVSTQLQLVMAEYRAARNNALTVVNTPNFSEMQKVWAANRKAMYARYYDMFKSYFVPINFRLNNAV
jgi:hypothetical protein